jgi:hypothetical protein
MSNHFMQVCQYGWTHGQCRCASKDKTVRLVNCTNSTHSQNPKTDETPSAGSQINALKGAINDIAKALNMGTKFLSASTDEFLMLAHEAEILAKTNADSARNALYDDRARYGRRNY